MSDEVIAMQVGKDVIKPIVEAKIQSAIVEALKGYDDMVATAVSRILQQKVDSSGEPDKYGYSGSLQFVQWLAKDAIAKAAKEAIKEWITERRDELRAEFTKQIKAKGGALAKAVVEGLVRSIECDWRMGVEVSFKEKK